MLAPEIVNPRAAEQGEGPLGFGAEERENALDSRRTERRQGVQIGPAGHAGARAHRERLDDMRAAADSAVKDDLDPVAHGIDDVGDEVDRRGRAVELPPTVIGDDHRGRPDTGRGAGVGAALQPLDRERLAPAFDQRLEPLPADMALHVCRHKGRQGRSIGGLAGLGGGDIGKGEAGRPRIAEAPGRLEREFEQARQGQARRYGEAAAQVALAIARDDRVDGQAQRVETRRLAAVDHLEIKGFVLEQIDLVKLGPGR